LYDLLKQNHKQWLFSKPMYKNSLIVTFIACFASIVSLAQDTVVVNTFNYGSTTRDTTIDFPTGGDSYEKILMLYSMRCKNGLVSDGSNRNKGCGEWDYSCNTYIEDPSKTDSLLATANEYSIVGFSGTSFNYKELAIFDYFRNTSIATQVNSGSFIDSAQLGNGTNATTYGIPGTLGSNPARIQHLFTAQELRNAGLSAGELWGIKVDAVNSATVSDLRINIKTTLIDSLSPRQMEFTGFTNVYSTEREFTIGTNQIQFHHSFAWDGISNIIIEFTSSKSITFQELLVNSTLQDTTRSAAAMDNSYIIFNGANYLESKSYEGVMGSQNRTCEAWIKTTGANQEIVGWGKNAGGQKWVFRTNTDGSLRVEVNGGGINATTPVNDNKWHHVACVLDGNKVSHIKMYVDGNLEAISATTDYDINTTADIKLRISRGVNDRYFVGSMDDVRIWDVALSQSDLQDLMRKKPAILSNLKAYFKFEDFSGAFRKDASSAAADLDMFGQEQVGKHRATGIFKDFEYTKYRVNIGWKMGDFNVTNDTLYSFDKLAHGSNLVKRYKIETAFNTTTDDKIVELESVERWNADEPEIYYDEYEKEYDRKTITAYGTIEITKLNYIRRWPSRLEIMSFVTPYGIALDLGPEGKSWTFDVTDFTPILKGNKRIFLSRGGENQEQMDIKFLFIKGTPARNVLDISQIWPTQQYSANYSQILANNVYFPPLNYKTIDTAKGFKIRSAITGHGQEGEFIPRNHFIKVNNDTYSRLVWKTCGDNPVYPQGGTWIYDRAGWCPGMATDVAEYDITGKIKGGETVALDYGLDDGSGDSRYIVNNQIVSYGAYNFGYDLGIVDIIEPSNKVEYARNNPTCLSPKIQVQNNGVNTVNSITIDYWVNDKSNKRTVTWPCFLKTGAIETVYLPQDNSIYSTAQQGNSKFFAQITAIDGNASADEYALNNLFESKFDFPEVYPQNFFLFYRTNSAPQETKIKVVDEWNKVVFEKNTFDANAIYRDTLNLGLGCYKLIVEDTDGDGLSFFANGDGSGFVRLWQVGGGIFKTLNPDFGNKTELQFTVVHKLDLPKRVLDLGYTLYPNPTRGTFTVAGLDLLGAKHHVFNAFGQELNAPFRNENGTELHYNLLGYASGVYFIKIDNHGQTWTQKIIVQ
jgi:hypothetical protein